MRFLALAVFIVFSGCKSDPINLMLDEVPEHGDSGDTRMPWPGSDSDAFFPEDTDSGVGSDTVEILVSDTGYPVAVDSMGFCDSATSGTEDSIDTGHEDSADPSSGDTFGVDSATLDTASAETDFVDTESQSETNYDTGTESTDSVFDDTGSLEDTDPIQTDTDLSTDEFKPWRPDIDDSSYWAKFYPDTVTIYRADLDQYTPGSYFDKDGDGFSWFDDCDDRDPLVIPGRYEKQNNGIDDNCNCKIDESPEDFEPTEDCPDNWWMTNFKNTTHTEWTLPGVDAYSADEAHTICTSLGYSWRAPRFVDAEEDFVNPKMGVDPETGDPSNAEGSCWCSFPWGGDPCGPPIWVLGFDEFDTTRGVMRCDAYIEDILDTDGGYMPPNREIYPQSQISGPIRAVCVREMPNGIE